MNEWIHSQTLKLVKKEDQIAFVEDVMDDLKEIDHSRIAGLGLSQDQLKHWLDASKDANNGS